MLQTNQDNLSNEIFFNSSPPQDKLETHHQVYLYQYLAKSKEIKAKLFKKLDLIINKKRLSFNAMFRQIDSKETRNLLKLKLRHPEFLEMAIKIKKGIRRNDPEDLAQTLEQIKLFLSL